MIITFTEEETRIKHNFKQQHIELCDEWFKQCLAWIHSEYPNISDFEVEHKVYAEWLALDFCEVDIPILPPNIQDAIEMTINEVIHLQLLYVVDISKPKYLQLKRIRNKFDDHTEDSESCGMLKLVLTDGVQEVSALEYVKISDLSLHLPPGLKVCLKPPIKIRRGQIILMPETIDILGGYVPELEVPNSAENILARALKQPLSTELAGQGNAATNQNANESRQTSAPAPPLPAQSNTNSENGFGDLIDDDMFYDHLNAMEENFRDEEFTNQTTAISSRGPPISSYNGGEFEDDDYSYCMPSTDTSDKSNAMNSSSKTQTSDASSSAHQLTLPKRSIMTIEKLNKIKSNVTKGNFTVKAEVIQIVQKFNICDDGFAMRVVLGDKTDQIEVNVHSDVLTELIEIDPDAFMEFFDSKDMVHREQLATHMQCLADKLNNFNEKLVISIEANKVPVITSVLEN